MVAKYSMNINTTIVIVSPLSPVIDIQIVEDKINGNEASTKPQPWIDYHCLKDYKLHFLSCISKTKSNITEFISPQHRCGKQISPNNNNKPKYRRIA